MIDEIPEKLQNIYYEKQFNFSKHTSYGLGGAADIAFYPANKSELRSAVEFFNETDGDYVILGNGTNVLVSDKHFEGGVICSKRLDKIVLNKDYVFCEAGVTVSKFLEFCKNNSLGGFEFLAGIPATLGGIVYMNGGADGKYIADRVQSVSLYNAETQEFADFSNFECNFSNKHSTMQDIKCFIYGFELKFERSDGKKIAQNIEYYLNRRRHLPKGKSCGCVFKNYYGESAGKIIDLHNLKGLRVGGAEVSKEHANFFLNRGGCAQDVYRLIKRVKREIFQKSGIQLEEEVRYIGEFDDTDG